VGCDPRTQLPRADVHARTVARDSYAIYTVNFVFLNVIYLQNPLTDDVALLHPSTKRGEDVIILEKLKAI